MLAPEYPSTRSALLLLRGLRTALILAVLGVVCTQDGRSQSTSQGPLALAERNPLYDLFYVPRFASADPLPRNETRLDVGIAYSNIFERSETATHSQLFDLERMSTTVTVRRGVTQRLEVGAHLTAHTSWGGFLDPLIEGVHEAFGVSNGDRHLVENGGHAVTLRKRDGTTLVDLAQRGFAPADLHVFGTMLLAGGQDHSSSVSIRTTLKLPTGIDGTGTDAADIAAEVLGRRSNGDWHFHGLLGATRLSPTDQLAGLSRRAAALFGLGVERSLSPTLSVVLQAQGSSNYVSGIGEDELDHIPFIVGAGLAGTSERWAWQVAFVEDIPPNSPSADVTLHVQFSRRWE